MGCRCCKMIQSYLFDPVQAPSPGYVNEVSSCKLDEDNTAKLKDKQGGEVQVHKNDLQSEGLKRTESRTRTGSWPHRGPLSKGEPEGSPCGDKTDGAVNGVGPTASPQPTENPRLQPGGRDSLDSPTNDSLLTLPFLDGGDSSKQDCVLPALEEFQVIQNGDSRLPSETESHALHAQDHVLQIPAPDYPHLWDSAVDNGDHDGKDRSRTENDYLEEIFLRGRNTSSRERRWGSLSEGVTAEVLRVSFREGDPTHSMPLSGTSGEQEDVHSCNGDRNGEMLDEDAAVAEALAALEAATAGEDADEVY
ncbi:PDCD10 and GCKIII kinases-associated protein 1 [Rhynchocyon petersi]